MSYSYRTNIGVRPNMITQMDHGDHIDLIDQIDHMDHGDPVSTVMGCCPGSVTKIQGADPTRQTCAGSRRSWQLSPDSMS